MFYFVNLGTFLAYGSGALMVGGGGYTVWCFKDNISESVNTEEALSSQSTNPKQNSSISTQFQEDLEKIAKKQEQAIHLENEVTQMSALNQIYQQKVLDLDKSIKDLEAKEDGWDAIIQESQDKIADIEKNKKIKTDSISSQTQQYEQLLSSIDTLKGAIKSASEATTKSQQVLSRKEAAKEAAETAFDKHQEDLLNVGKIITHITTSITHLNSQKDINKSNTEEETTNKSTKITEIVAKTNEIKSTINQKITELTGSIVALEENIKSLKTQVQQKQTTISRLTGQLNSWTSKAGDDTNDKNKKSWESEKKAAETFVTTTQQTISEKELTKTTQTTSKNQLSEQLNALQPFVEKYTTQDALKSSIKNASDQIKTLNEQQSQIEDKLTKLEQGKAAIESRLALATTSLNTEQSKKQKLDDMTSMVEGTKESTAQDYNTQSQDIAQKHQQHAEYVKELSEKEKKSRDQKKELNQMKEEEQKFSNEIASETAFQNDWKKQKEDSKKELERKEALKKEQETSIKNNQEKIKSQQAIIQTIKLG